MNVDSGDSFSIVFSYWIHTIKILDRRWCRWCFISFYFTHDFFPSFSLICFCFQFFACHFIVAIIINIANCCALNDSSHIGFPFTHFFLSQNWKNYFCNFSVLLLNFIISHLLKTITIASNINPLTFSRSYTHIWWLLIAYKSINEGKKN